MSIAVYRNGQYEPTDDPATVRNVAARFGARRVTGPTLVFFGGWKGSRPNGGPVLSQIEQDDRGNPVNRSSFTALMKIADFFSLGRIWDYDPACVHAQEASVGVTDALGQLARGFDPCAPLVIYGYSAGGYNALGLCLGLKDALGWYSFRNQRLEPAGERTGSERLEGGPLRVDLLITVDACIAVHEATHPNGKPLPHAPRPLVTTYLNFYQNKDHLRHGHQAATADNPRVHVRQYVGGEITHDGMPTCHQVETGVRAGLHQVFSRFAGR